MKKLKEIVKNLKNVEPGTWLRLVMLLAALVSMSLKVFGVSAPVPEREVPERVLTVAVTVICSLCSYWKNNSFTEAAQIADKLMESIKKE